MHFRFKKLLSLFLALTILFYFFSCNQPSSSTAEKSKEPRYIGSIERLDSSINNLIAPGAKIEIIADSFDWSEGPLWVDSGNYLLFSDIPPNTIFKWDEKNGLSKYLQPSGYTGSVPRGGEQGSNALILDPQGNLVLCQHGDRRLARMNAPLSNPASNFVTIADKFEGKKFNSPNDGVYKSNGDLYITDPPYGLEKRMDDPAKELNFQGVYRIEKNGKVDLLTKELSRPNGIAFSPDEKKLYVANSDSAHAVWMVYDVTDSGTITNGKIFYDATSLTSKVKGLPDGMKIDNNGNIFAAGPGGVWVFDKDAKVLGKIKTGEAVSNCAFNKDKSVLFITSDMYVVRVKLK
ncbi:MAG: gluconolactonase [Bacteroidetes bacterium]|nr:MAG: gluconolactonase [Bacteroidota bacterium]